ncbi:Protein kinase domain/Protein tyrosine kinase, putative [Leishmania lindenbergi]|uniref:Protein kinase domain-containing protein n=1 Tax=Leishmania lindenbergi TaxID=651832 RepID=A0AAW3AXR2_9TRYP
MAVHIGVATMLPTTRENGRHRHHPHPQRCQQQPTTTSSSIAGCEPPTFAVTTTASGEGSCVHSGSSAQPRPRHRRSRSIHITLRKTRSGSRPVSAQRDSLTSMSRDLGAASSATGGARGRTPNTHQYHGSIESPSGASGDAASPASAATAAGTPPGSACGAALVPFTSPAGGGFVSPKLTPRHHGAASTSPRVPAGGAHQAPLFDSVANSNNNINSCGSSRMMNSLSYTPYILHTHGRSGDCTVSDGTTAAAAGATNVGSSSSSMVGGAGGSSSSVGPSSGSCVPTVHGFGYFNTFMNANHPYDMKQALLPPNMRDRALGLDAAHSDQAAAATAAHRRPFSSGAMPRRKGISSGNHGRVYCHPSVFSPQAVSQVSHANGYRGRLRSNSMSSYNTPVDVYNGSSHCRSATAMQRLNDFVFPYPESASGAPHQQPHQPQPGHPPSSAWCGHLSNMPTVNLETSPRLWLSAAHTAVQGQQEQRCRHHRARSYTVGGHVRSNSGCGRGDIVAAHITAEATTNGTSVSVGYAGNTAPCTPDRPISLASSIPAAAVPVVGAMATTAGGLCSRTSTLIHHSSVSTAASSVATTIPTVMTTLPAAPSLPAHTKNRISSAVTDAMTPQTRQPAKAAVEAAAAEGTSAPRSTRVIANLNPSAFFGSQRSVSSDIVNGLDDSVDSVRCGSLPSPNTSATNVMGSASGTPDRCNHGTSTAAGRYGGTAAFASSHRYARDSMASENKADDEDRRHSALLCRCSTTLTNTTTDENEQQHATQRLVIEMLRRNGMRRKSSTGGGVGNVNVAAVLSRARSARTNATSAAAAAATDIGGSPTTAIERWRAQEQQKKREGVQQHRLSAQQWREAFRRLQEKRVRWHMRGYIGRGTSGVVYEGILEDCEHTPVAVKVLEVGVPMPVDLDTSGNGDDSKSSRQTSYTAIRGTAKSASAAASEDETYMSPSQQEALLVLLREVEMMEKLHHENIVTCLRCQVTPVQNRYLELRQQQQRRRRGGSSSDDNWLSAVAVAGRGGERVGEPRHDSGGTSSGENQSPLLNAAARIPVQVEIVMELCNRGTLSSVVRQTPGGQLPVQVARRYLRHVLKGLAYLHHSNFIHRDVKGDNVLISAADVAKLADFGCSRRIMLTNNVYGAADSEGVTSSIATTRTAATDSRFTTIAEYQWFDTTGVAKTMVGTPMFMAPEIILASGTPSMKMSTASSPTSSVGGGNNGGPGSDNKATSPPAPVGYTASADIWSFGCLVLEVFGRTPWPTSGSNAYHLMKQIEQSVANLPPGVPHDTPAELLSLLRCCFHRDPHRRSTARALLRAPWMMCKDEELEEMPPRRRC